MVAFLGLMRRQNPDKPLCIFVLDNARIHHAKTVKIRAEELNIHFIYIPPYSPNLNPIELDWKDLKRELSNTLDSNEMIKSCEGVALDLFDKRKQGYLSYRVKEFISAEN